MSTNPVHFHVFICYGLGLISIFEFVSNICFMVGNDGFDLSLKLIVQKCLDYCRMFIDITTATQQRFCPDLWSTHFPWSSYMAVDLCLCTLVRLFIPASIQLYLTKPAGQLLYFFFFKTCGEHTLLGTVIR